MKGISSQAGLLAACLALAAGCTDDRDALADRGVRDAPSVADRAAAEDQGDASLSPPDGADLAAAEDQGDASLSPPDRALAVDVPQGTDLATAEDQGDASLSPPDRALAVDVPQGADLPAGEDQGDGALLFIDRAVGPDVPEEALWYADRDSDGHGDPSLPLVAPVQPEGYAALADDCDDTQPAVHPGALEVCDGLDNDCDGEVDEGCFIEHCGVLSQSETWSSQVIHRVTCSVLVEGPAHPQLTIEDGAEVRFERDTELIVGRGRPGRLIVNGHLRGVLFTSAAPQPRPGDWLGLAMEALDEGSVLTGLTVELAGDDGGIRMTGTQATVIQTTVRHCLGHGLVGTSSAPLIHSSTFRDNGGDGIFLDEASVLSLWAFRGNVMSRNEGYAITLGPGWLDSLEEGPLAERSSFEGNRTGGIRVHGGVVTESACWPDLGVPIFAGGTIFIQGPAAPWVSVADGVVVDFGRDGGLVVGLEGPGRLDVGGLSAGVLFTSAAREPGSWAGLLLGPQDNGSMLLGLTVEYGREGIVLEGAAPDIADCQVRCSEGHGLVGISASPWIRGSVFRDNGGDGVYLDEASGLAHSVVPTFRDNVMVGNGGYAITLSPAPIVELYSSSSFEGNGLEGIRVHGGVVAEESHWQNLGVPYVVEGIVAVDGPLRPTLGINDGTVLRFGPGAGLSVGEGQGGRLSLSGSDRGVLFTSSQAEAQPGDWRGVTFGEYDNGSLLQGLTVEYGGGGMSGAIFASAAHMSLMDCTVRRSATHGLFGRHALLTISQSTFSDNLRDGIYLDEPTELGHGQEDTFFGNVIRGNGEHAMTLAAWEADQLASCTFSDNAIQAIRLLGSTLGENAEWRNLGVSYLLEQELVVEGSDWPCLDIEAGTEVIFHEAGQIVVGERGSLRAIGEPGEEIVFTAWEPSPGAWPGLFFGGGCYGANVVLRHVVVEHGGANGFGNIHIDGCSGSFVDSLVRYSSRWGIYVASGSPDIRGISYYGNTLGDLWVP